MEILAFNAGREAIESGMPVSVIMQEHNPYSILEEFEQWFAFALYASEALPCYMTYSLRI